MYLVVTNACFFFRMRRLLLTLDTTDILCLACAIFFHTYLNKLRIKCQSYPKQTKFDAFEQRLRISQSPN